MTLYFALNIITKIFPRLPNLQAYLYKLIFVCLNTYNARNLGINI